MTVPFAVGGRGSVGKVAGQRENGRGAEGGKGEGRPRGVGNGPKEHRPRIQGRDRGSLGGMAADQERRGSGSVDKWSRVTGRNDRGSLDGW
jgi:hypothetical protein